MSGIRSNRMKKRMYLIICRIGFYKSFATRHRSAAILHERAIGCIQIKKLKSKLLPVLENRELTFQLLSIFNYTKILLLPRRGSIRHRHSFPPKHQPDLHQPAAQPALQLSAPPGSAAPAVPATFRVQTPACRSPCPSRPRFPCPA